MSKFYKFPPGHPQSRMSDADIERKFFELSDGVLARDRAQQIVDSVWTIEGSETLDELMNLTVNR